MFDSNQNKDKLLRLKIGAGKVIKVSQQTHTALIVTTSFRAVDSFFSFTCFAFITRLYSNVIVSFIFFIA